MDSELLTEIRIGLLLGGNPTAIVKGLAKSGRYQASHLMIGLLKSKNPGAIVEELVPAHDECLRAQQCSLLMN